MRGIEYLHSKRKQRLDALVARTVIHLMSPVDLAARAHLSQALGETDTTYQQLRYGSSDGMLVIKKLKTMHDTDENDA